MPRHRPIAFAHTVSRRLVLQAAGVALVAPAHAAELHQIDDHRVSVPSAVPHLVIARGQSPAKNTMAALARLGGMKRFVKPGDSVLVKPNAGWKRRPAQAANTNPEVVEAVVRACAAAGAGEVIVIDGSVHDPQESLEKSGIMKAAGRAGAKVLLPDQVSYLDVAIPGLAGRWPVLAPFVQADKIINVPIAKHHGSARVTAGMKNWIGITRKNRSTFHSRLDHSIAALAALMRPTLTVVDATRILLRNGPQGGNLGDVKRADTIAVSLDPVAVDAWAAELLGASLGSVGYLRLAAKLGLGNVDYRSLSPVELQI